MSNKGDCLQKGELVKFQVCTVSQTGQKMACNVVPQRRALVECVKDQVDQLFVFSFISATHLSENSSVAVTVIAAQVVLK